MSSKANENLTGPWAWLRKVRLSGKSALALEIVLVALAYALAVYIRVQPILEIGPYFTSDDPLFHYRLTKYLIENGKLPEKDFMTWFPWGTHGTGLFVENVFPVFHYYLAAFLYKALLSLGMNFDLFVFCSYLPAFFGPISCVIVYLIGRIVWNKYVGVFAAFFLSLNTGYLSRTIGGFFRHEQFAVPFILATVLFFILSVKEDSELKTSVYASIAGLLLGVSAGLWKGFRFLVGGISLFLFFLIITGKLNKKLTFSATVTLIVGLAFTLILPHEANYILKPDALVALSSIVSSMTYLLLEKEEYIKRVLASLVAGAVFFLILWYLVGTFFTGRIMYVLSPFREEKPGDVTITVAEHVGGLFLSRNVGIALLLSIPGFYLVLKSRKMFEVFLAWLTVLSFYFMVNMPSRITVLFSPFITLIASVTFSLAIDKFKDGWRITWLLFDRQMKKKKLRMKLKRPNFGPLKFPSFMLIVLLLSLLVNGVQGYEVSATYHEGLSPYRLDGGEWVSACRWLKDNSSRLDIIMSWWDYGYLIQTYGERTTLIDGATTNFSLIREVATAFMSSEEEAWKFCNKFNVSYVVVDMYRELSVGTNYPLVSGVWIPMAFISKKISSTSFGEVSKYIRIERDRIYPTQLAYETTIFRFAIATDSLRFFKLVYKTEPYPVFVFKVVRPE